MDHFIPESTNYDIINACGSHLGHNILNRQITYLEIGVNEGHSMYRILEESPISHAVGIDTWGDKHGGRGRGSPDHVWAIMTEEMKRALVLLTGSSRDLLPKLLGTFDLIFVDADHSATGCHLDMVNSLRLMSAEGYMIVDDIDNPYTKQLRGVARDFAVNHDMGIQYFAKAHMGVAVLHNKGAGKPIPIEDWMKPLL